MAIKIVNGSTWQAEKSNRIDADATLTMINYGRGAPDPNGVRSVSVVQPANAGPKDASMSIGYANRSVIQRSGYQ